MALTISLVMLLVISSRFCNAYKITGNVALKGKAVLSSTWGNSGPSYVAAFAVNGKNDAIDSSCACTQYQANPWLRVELPQVYKVARVALGYPENCCQTGFTGAQIYVGNSLKNNGTDNPMVAVVKSVQVNAKRKVEYSFQPVQGKYVTVMLPAENKYLLICEVEVYALVEDRVVNLALKGRATQSSLANGNTASFGLAQNAVDGNHNPDLRKGSCSHTDEEKDPWWRIDLLDKHTITSVSLTNRGDCCAHRLDGAVIHVGNSVKSEGQENPVCANVPSLQAGETKTFSCSRLMDGRYVTIVLPGEKKVLSMCEVEVNGFALDKAI